MKSLYYFTDSYPYGLGETWKLNELIHLRSYFDEITVVPLSYAGNKTNPKKVPDRINVEKPLFDEYKVSVSAAGMKNLIGKNVFYYLKEFLVKKVFLNKTKFITWLEASLKIEALSKTPFFKELQEKDGKDAVLYFYWGKGACDFVPLLKNRSKFARIVVRMHRYDLFEYENKNYIPYRKSLLQNITFAIPSSKAGADHLLENYPACKNKIRVFRCGTVHEGFSSPSEDNRLRLLTCSYVVPVKRLNIIAEALKHLSIPVQWTHLGDGPLRFQLQDLIKDIRSNIIIDFPGMVLSTEVLKYYINHPIDVFLNVSSSEGVPFSIMEALSAGIPVFATRVGGTGEIIDDSVGKILPSDVTPEMLSKEIEKFYFLADEEKKQKRVNAYNRYEQHCNANILAKELGSFLSNS